MGDKSRLNRIPPSRRRAAAGASSVQPVCWMWTGALFVAQKSQVEILILVAETVSRVHDLRKCGGKLSLPHTPTLAPLRWGLFFATVFTAAATCPALWAALSTKGAGASLERDRA
jgi:hypothetical protein